MNINFKTTLIYDHPETCKEYLSNFAEDYFHLSGPKAHVIDPRNLMVQFQNDSTSLILSIIKVISYATLIFPLIMFIAKICLRADAEYQVSPSQNVQAVLDQAPKFRGYQIGRGTPYEGITLTSASIRPANLFYKALLGPNSVTLPGSNELFAFQIPHEQIRARIITANPTEVVSFTAKGTPGFLYSRTHGHRDIEDLSELYGNATYRLSIGELQSTLDSQKIYVASPLPLRFYRALKQAMKEDGIVILPGSDANPVLVKNLQSPHVQALIQSANTNPQRFDFSSRGHWETLSHLTIYQLGSLVVKSENYRIFMDSDGKILERNPGDQDEIRLLNACGIRGIHATDPEHNRTIMTSTFKAALRAAETGHLIFPAVGMGVWRGDPDLYWRAFLDTVVTEGTPLDNIYVNPGHQTSINGPFRGCSGEEFQQLLNEYRSQFAADATATVNLAKIVNLYEAKTDVVQLSYHLKKAFPDKIVSLFNASDPDVTLGNHVGEYVNNLDHATTTEENYTAMGTNGLCFESITQIHQNPSRLIEIMDVTE